MSDKNEPTKLGYPNSTKYNSALDILTPETTAERMSKSISEPSGLSALSKKFGQQISKLVADPNIEKVMDLQNKLEFTADSFATDLSQRVIDQHGQAITDALAWKPEHLAALQLVDEKIAVLVDVYRSAEVSAYYVSTQLKEVFDEAKTIINQHTESQKANIDKFLKDNAIQDPVLKSTILKQINDKKTADVKAADDNFNMKCQTIAKDTRPQEILKLASIERDHRLNYDLLKKANPEGYISNLNETEISTSAGDENRFDSASLKNINKYYSRTGKAITVANGTVEFTLRYWGKTYIDSYITGAEVLRAQGFKKITCNAQHSDKDEAMRIARDQFQGAMLAGFEPGGEKTDKNGNTVKIPCNIKIIVNGEEMTPDELFNYKGKTSLLTDCRAEYQKRTALMDTHFATVVKDRFAALRKTATPDPVAPDNTDEQQDHRGAPAR